MSTENNIRVTVAEGWVVEAQSDDTMRLTEVGVFSLPINRDTQPMTFRFLQTLHAQKFKLQE